MATNITSASPNWKMTTDDLQVGAETVTIATYNDGATETEWKAGFDNTNQPLITQASTTGTTGWVHNGEFINDELTTTPLTITGLTGSPLAPTGIVRSNLESGWKYLGTLTSPNGQLYFIYASIDTASHRVIQVVFSCTCDGLYIDSNQPVYYVRTGEKIDPAKTYVVAGWASVNENTEGPQIWDVVENYIRNEGSISVQSNNHVKVVTS